MIRIDLVGAPGAGKTTLLKKLRRSKGRQWLSKEEAVFKAARNAKINPVYKLYFFFLFMVFGKNHAARRVVFEWPEKDLGNDVFDSYLQIFKEKLLQRLENNLYSSSAKFNSTISYALRIKELAIISTWCMQDIVVFDESLTHHTSTNLLNIALTDSKIRSCVFPNGVVNVSDSPDRISKRLNERKNRGTAIARHKTMNEEEMGTDTIACLGSVKKKISFFNQHNIPVLEINGSSHINCQKKTFSRWLATLVA